MHKAITLLLSLYAYTLTAQDPHFSNYTNNPLELNPALTGQIYNHTARLQFGHRSQWGSVLKSGEFKTAYASFDRRFCTPQQGDYWALGLRIMGDQRGDFPLERADAFLSGAYMKRLQNNNRQQTYLGIGVEAGAIHHRLGKRDFTFDEQFDDPGASGENFDRFNFTFLDYGAGLSYYVTSKEFLGAGYHVGLSLKHLTHPEYKFWDVERGQESVLQRRLTVHAGGILPLSNKTGNISLAYKGMYMQQAPFWQTVHTLDVLIKFNETSLISLGGGYRMAAGQDGFISDALIPSASLITDSFYATFSYDANLSSLRVASRSIGAFELTVGFTFGDGKCQGVYCSYF